MPTNIDYLLSYEEFLPVLTNFEVDLLLASRPSLAQLQDWSQRLNNHRARLEIVFSRAYKKLNEYGR